MKRVVVGTIAAAVLMSMATRASGQARTVSSEMRVETAIVETVDASTRTVTLKKPDGTVVSVVAGPDIARFSEIRVGDKVTARYYENVVIRLKRPGEPDTIGEKKGTTPALQELPGGTKARQRTITGTIAAIDMNAPSVTFTGPSGLKFTSKVQDKEALAKVKVGEKVEIVWTEAVLVSMEPMK